LNIILGIWFAVSNYQNYQKISFYQIELNQQTLTTS